MTIGPPPPTQTLKLNARFSVTLNSPRRLVANEPPETVPTNAEGDE